MKEFLYMGVVVFTCLFLMILAPALVARQINRHFATTSCRKFSEVSGFKTKWADYTFWNYECLAQTTEGKWLPKDQIREITN